MNRTMTQCFESLDEALQWLAQMRGRDGTRRVRDAIEAAVAGGGNMNTVNAAYTEYLAWLLPPVHTCAVCGEQARDLQYVDQETARFWGGPTGWRCPDRHDNPDQYD